MSGSPRVIHATSSPAARWRATWAAARARSGPGRPGPGHGEGDPLDHEARERLAHDGLGPADGVDGRGRGHHPVGPAQGGHGPDGEQVGLAGADADADQAAGKRRVGGRHRLGAGLGAARAASRAARMSRLPIGRFGRPGRPGRLQPIGQIEAALAHRPPA